MAIPAGKRGGTLKAAMIFMTPDFDILERGSSQAPTLNQLGNLLIEYNPETEDTLDIRGDLATSWDLSADGTSYTFFLNPKAKWHDGVPVTAADVKWTLDISAFPPEGETRHSLAFFKPFYESSQVIDDNTVRVNSKFPSPAFFQYLAMNYHQILPKHHYEGMSAEDRDFEENSWVQAPSSSRNSREALAIPMKGTRITGRKVSPTSMPWSTSWSHRGAR
jgi:peptide/nickel transport system substrate-binding protein